MADRYEELKKLVDDGEFSTAEPQVLDWLQYHPNDARAWLLYGRCLSNPTQKVDCFKRALALDPSNVEASELLKQLHFSSTTVPQTTPRTRPAVDSPPLSPVLPTSTPSFPAISKPRPQDTRFRTNLFFVLYSLFHLVFTILLASGLVFLFVFLVPGLLAFETAEDTIQRNWLSNNSGSGTIPELQSLAMLFLNPSRLDYRDVGTYQELRNFRTSLAAGSTGNNSVEFTGIRFTGQLTGGYVLERGSEGQPIVIVMEIMFDDTRIPVVYYGPSDRFKYEDVVLVEGVYVEEANGIVAQRVEQRSTEVSTPLTSTIWNTLRIAVIVLLWSLFCFSVFIWRINHKIFRQRISLPSSVVTLLLSILSVFLLSACRIDLSTTLHDDGTGFTSILVHESRENMEFLRSAPGVPGYLSAVARDMQDSGAMFDQYIDGDQEVFLIQRYFNTSNADTGDTYPIEGSWISVQRYQQGDEAVMRFLGVVDTRTLYNTPGTVDPNVAGALRDQLDQIDMQYRLHFPGRLIYHNAANITDQKITWQIRMNDVNYLVAEVRMPIGESPVPGVDIRFVWLALGVIFLISTSFLIATFWIRPSR